MIRGLVDQPRPQASSPSVRARMEGQRRRDTKPEMTLRSALWRSGLRYRVDLEVHGRRRRVDIAFTRRRLAVFVDGCFWHSCPEHGTVPKANREWWKAKLEANVTRDRATDVELRSIGWTVLRVWEHEDMAIVASQVEALLTCLSRRGNPRDV